MTVTVVNYVTVVNFMNPLSGNLLLYIMSESNQKIWIFIHNYQKNLLLEQQYLCGQRIPFWTEEPTTTNTKFEEQPIEEINKYIQIFTTINLEIE